MRLQSLSASSAQCLKCEAVGRSLYHRARSLAHRRTHTHAQSRRPHCAGSLLSLGAVFGHRARASPARPAPSSRAERTIRGPAQRGAGEEGSGQEGATEEGCEGERTAGGGGDT